MVEEFLVDDEFIILLLVVDIIGILFKVSFIFDILVLILFIISFLIFIDLFVFKNQEDKIEKSINLMTLILVYPTLEY